MTPPEVHSELTSHGNDGLLALRPGSSGSFCQNGEPLLHRVISVLKAHHAPCQLNQKSAQPAISMFCDRTRHAFGPRAMLARTEARVTGDLTPVLEALPIANLAANDYAAQGAHPHGQRGRSRLLHLDNSAGAKPCGGRGVAWSYWAATTNFSRWMSSPSLSIEPLLFIFNLAAAGAAVTL